MQEVYVAAQILIDLLAAGTMAADSSLGTGLRSRNPGLKIMNVVLHILLVIFQLILAPFLYD